MLIPEISIKQNDSSSIIIKDTTPDFSINTPGGYGSPNYSLSDTDKVRMELTYPNGGIVVFEALYKRGDPDWIVRYEDLQNIARQAEDGCSSCGDSHQSSAGVFPSGCYKIKYKVMGYGTRIVERSNYFLSAIGNPIDRVWAKADGVFVDITPAGTWIGNNFQWSSSNTYTEYTDYEIRNGSVIKGYGSIVRTRLGVFQTFVGSDFVVLGETTKSFVLFFNEYEEYHKLIFKLLDFDNSGCYDFFKNPCGRGQDLAELILVKSKLDIIDGETNCIYVNDLLKRINGLLKSIKENG